MPEDVSRGRLVNRGEPERPRSTTGSTCRCTWVSVRPGAADPSERVDRRWFAGLSSPTAIVISILVVYVLLGVGVYALITSFA
jgi:hypothetical protein